MITSVKVGERLPSVTHLTPLLPTGTTLGNSLHAGATYTLVAPSTWVQGSSLADPYYLNQKMWLHSLGDGSEELVLPKMSATSFRWMLRDAAFSAAERSGVALGPVETLCAYFGMSEPLFREGGVVSSRHDLQYLPAGSVYYAGHPDRPEWLGVWEVDEHGVHHHLMGTGVSEGTMRTIRTLPGEEGEAEAPASPETLASIAFRAYSRGRRLKERHGWCSVFENTLDALAIDQSMISQATDESAFGVGDVLDTTQAGMLPVGSYLAWTWRNGSGIALYQRVDGATNRAQTRRVWGHEDDGGSSHPHMTVIQTADEPMEWTVVGSHLQRMPVGVRYRRPSTLAPRVTGDGYAIDVWANYIVTGWVA